MFDEMCVAVVLNKNIILNKISFLNKNSVQVLDFVGQTVVLVANNLCSSRQGSYRSRFV